MKLCVNLFCRNLDAQFAFYETMLGLPEAVKSRSPIYRCIQDPTFEFGFHAAPAYALLGMADRAPPPGQTTPVTTYATFMLGSSAEVDALCEKSTALGGRIVKTPYPTYYGQWQAVLADPENNLFRLSFQGLPEGVMAPKLVL